MGYKTYTLLNLHSLVTSFATPNGVKVVNFNGGSRYHNRKGSFSTNDKELQKAIEQSNAYGWDYILTQEEKEEEKPLEKAQAEEPVKVVIEVDYKDFVTDKENLVEEQSVTTIQKAKMWLQANYGKTFKGTSKAEIKKEAAELYNTIFVNWA
jgi:hypothetical protein